MSDGNWRGNVMNRLRDSVEDPPGRGRGRRKTLTLEMPEEHQARLEILAKRWGHSPDTLVRFAVALLIHSKLKVELLPLAKTKKSQTNKAWLGIENFCPHPGCNGDHIKATLEAEGANVSPQRSPQGE